MKGVNYQQHSYLTVTIIGVHSTMHLMYPNYRQITTMYSYVLYTPLWCALPYHTLYTPLWCTLFHQTLTLRILISIMNAYQGGHYFN